MKPRPGHPPITRLWRLLAGLWAAAAVLVATGYVAASTVASRRNSEVTRQLASLGLPTRLEDFPAAPASAGKTAISEYLAAGRAIAQSGVDSPSNSLWTDGQYGRVPFPREWWALVENSAQAHQGALRQALAAEGLEVGTLGARQAAIDGTLVGNAKISREWSDLRTLVNALSDHALRAHFLGDDNDAMLYLRTALSVSRSVAEHGPVYSETIALSCGSEVISKIFLIVGELSIGDDLKRASREQVQGLITDLLTYPDRKSLVASVAFEAAIAARDSDRAPVFNRVLLLAPLRKHLVAMWRGPSLRDAQILSGEPVTWSNPAARLLPGVSNLWAPSGLISNAKYYGTELFYRRAGAIALACALYRYDHAGAWPVKGADLVPRYLPAMPVDPLSPDNAPLEYRLAEGGKRPVVLQSAKPEGPWTDADLRKPPVYGLDSRQNLQFLDLGVFPRVPGR